VRKRERERARESAHERETSLVSLQAESTRPQSIRLSVCHHPPCNVSVPCIHKKKRKRAPKKEEKRMKKILALLIKEAPIHPLIFMQHLKVWAAAS
jgi:hypothetical protein